MLPRLLVVPGHRPTGLVVLLPSLVAPGSEPETAVLLRLLPGRRVRRALVVVLL